MTTIEQESLVNLNPANGITKVFAFAGAGKTYSLCKFSERQQLKGKRGIYLAFNKAAEQDARKRFPASVKCLTVNGLAYSSKVS